MPADHYSSEVDYDDTETGRYSSSSSTILSIVIIIIAVPTEDARVKILHLKDISCYLTTSHMT